MKKALLLLMAIGFFFTNLSAQKTKNDPPRITIVSPTVDRQNIPVDIKFDIGVYRSGGKDSIPKPLGGDNFFNTWAADDKIYVTVDDGLGWQKETGSPKNEALNNRVWALRGGPNKYIPEYLSNFPEYELRNDMYGFGIVAVDGYLYYTISTPYQPDKIGVKLLYSDDYGSNWYRHNGINDQIDKYEVSDSTMFFYNEPNNLFSYIDFVQCGKDYQDSKDNYVYLYCKLTNPFPSIYLAKVPKGHQNIIDKSKYEYFKGYNDNDKPIWTSDISSSGIVLTFNKGYFHSGFLPSVVYNKGLDLYIMTVGARHEDRFRGGSSVLSFYWSKNPWGKWTPFYHTDNWVGDSPDNILYQPRLVSKFTSEDGKTMYMNYSDCRKNWGDHYVYNQQKIIFELGETAHYNFGDDITISLEATDVDGSIEKVEYYQGSVLLGKDTSSPYQYVWKGAAIGTHKITVMAFDDEGQRTDASIYVTIAP
jgi:hypothetical protein